jgi:DNA polymerase III epsilon subunit-like protein
LLEPEGNPLENQPYIIEAFILRVDDSGQEEEHFHSFVKPPKPLPERITKITGITEVQLADAPTFVEIYRPLVNIFFGAHTMVAHNLPFDLGVLVNELKRIDKEHKFPYPPIHFCTVANSINVRGQRLKLQELYQIATGRDAIENAHRAEADVMALLECYLWLRNGGKNELAQS